ncbi:hypothetical protein [Streptomyces melanogenes]|uniref:hypothetical protein n=1 Tax=Streptomyces melanogenes TaxID=67326 RepID=UPI0037AEDC16
MTARSDRRWAELAREAEFAQLPEVRRQAEGWRTGLAGLTALLAVLTVVKGPDSLANVPRTAAHVSVVLAAAGFTVLLAGTLLAVRAAHGRPEREIVLGGQALRRWTRGEVARAGRRLRWAAVCCVSGVLLSAGAVGVAWTAAAPAGRQPVRVITLSGETLCGELVGAGPEAVVVRAGAGPPGPLRSIPYGTLVSLTPVRSC